MICGSIAAVITRRDFLKLSGAALAATALPRIGLGASDPPSPPIIYHGSRFYRRLAITYDDLQLMTRLLMLQQALMDNPDVRVTLFPVGSALPNNESKRPGIWKWFYSHGHEFGYHSWDHTDPYVMSDEQLLKDYDRWENALYQVLGDQPLVRFARPPFGNLSKSFLNMCVQRGKVATMWSTGFGGAIDVGVNAAKRAKNGDIALMHTRNQPAIPAIQQEESWDMTITAQILPYFTSIGMECVGLARIYDDLIREQNDSSGCNTGDGDPLTRSCLDQLGAD